MAAIEWLNIHEQEFTPDEAREASDFDEVIRNFGLPMSQVREMFRGDPMSLGRRLFFVVRCDTDDLPGLVMQEQDPRLSAIARARMEEKSDGHGIILNPSDC